MEQDSKNTPIQVTITTGTVWRVFLVAFLILLGYLLFDLVLILLTSVVIASAVEPATRWFMDYKFPRVLAVLFIYVVSFCAVFSFLYIFIPPLFLEVSDLSNNIPEQIDSSSVVGYNFEPVLSLGGIEKSFALKDLIKPIEQSVGQFTGGLFTTASTVFGGAFSFILILVISFYLSVQEKGIENFIKLVVPYRNEPYILDLWNRSQTKIGQWMKGQIVLALIVGVLVFLGLTILQIKYAFVLAVIAAFFELIPVFGPILAAVPAVMLAFTDNPTAGLMVIGLYVIIQQFENHLIYPLVVKKVVGLSPIIVILALLVGAKIAGFLGIILSVPMATILMEIVNDFEKRKTRTNEAR